MCSVAAEGSVLCLQVSEVVSAFPSSRFARRLGQTVLRREVYALALGLESSLESLLESSLESS